MSKGISIIIPTYNEATHIGELLHYLQSIVTRSVVEIIVSDGGSDDQTVSIAKDGGATVVKSPDKGRAAQMNYGALQACYSIFYFLHADTYPPRSFVQDIWQAIEQGYDSGCFRLSFDHPHWFLKANCWFTRFDVNQFRFGDQSLFVIASIFKTCGGFKESLIVLEDQEIILRIRKQTRFRILKGSVTTSARKYLVNGIYKTQAVYFLIYVMYQLGYSQQKLVQTYRSLIRQDKL